MRQNLEQIARICHEANRAYSATLGDDSQPAWEDAPAWQKEAAIAGVQFQMDRLKDRGKISASDIHNEWLRQKREEGWSYGPMKNQDLKQHPAIVEYDALSQEERMKDYLFAAIAEAFWRASQEENRK